MLLTMYPGSSMGATSRRRGEPDPTVTITFDISSVLGEKARSSPAIFVANCCSYPATAGVSTNTRMSSVSEPGTFWARTLCRAATSKNTIQQERTFIGSPTFLDFGFARAIPRLLMSVPVDSVLRRPPFPFLFSSGSFCPEHRLFRTFAPRYESQKMPLDMLATLRPCLECLRSSTICPARAQLQIADRSELEWRPLEIHEPAEQTAP